MDAGLLIEAAKLRIRKMNSDVLDEDVQRYIDVALADLERIGVPADDLQEPDALLTEAVLVYVQANFGGSVDEKLMKSYDMILTKIKGSKHCTKRS